MRSVQWRLLAALSLLFFAHCHAPVRPVTTEAYPVAEIAPRSLQPGQFGPFHTGMTSREAATLCLPPGEVDAAIAEKPDALGRARGTNFRCILRIGAAWYHARVFAAGQTITELKIRGPVPFEGKDPAAALQDPVGLSLDELGAVNDPKTPAAWQQRLERLLSLWRVVRPGVALRVLPWSYGWDDASSLSSVSAKAIWELQQKDKNKDLLLDEADFPDSYVVLGQNPALYIAFDGERRRKWEAWKQRQARPAAAAAVPETPVPVAPAVVQLDPAKDIQADRVGPFVHGMAIEEAAKLCNKELTDEERAQTTTDVTGKARPKEKMLFCDVRVGNRNLDLTLFFYRSKLDRVWLKAGPIEVRDRAAWLEQATALLDVLVQAGPGRGLQVGSFVSMRIGEGGSPWRGNQPPTAQELLGMLSNENANILGVAWVDSGYPLLRLGGDSVTLEFHFAQAKQKQAGDQPQPPAPQQAVAMPFPELAGLSLGASKAEAAAWLKKKKILKCVGLSKQEAADPKASIECPAVRFAGGNSVAWFGFEEGRLSGVRLYVQPSVQPLTSWKAAKPHALRLLKHLQQYAGPVEFDLGTVGRFPDEQLLGQLATPEVVAAELAKNDGVEFELRPQKNPQYELFATLGRYRELRLLPPRFGFRVEISRRNPKSDVR